MIVINTIRVDPLASKGLKYDNFYYSLPVVKNKNMMVHMVKVDMSDRHRFSTTLKVLSSEHLPPPFQIGEVLEHYQKRYY